jgi:hypothetical protein
MIGEKSGDATRFRRDGNGAGVEVINGPDFGAEEEGAGSGVGSGSTAEWCSLFPSSILSAGIWGGEGGGEGARLRRVAGFARAGPAAVRPVAVVAGFLPAFPPRPRVEGPGLLFASAAFLPTCSRSPAFARPAGTARPLAATGFSATNESSEAETELFGEETW